VVRDPGLRAEAVVAVADAAAARGWGARGVTVSPLPGPSGNVEFFLWLRHGPAAVDAEQITAVVRRGTGGAETDERVTP
jgi:23S rRNA (cytidine1920-2'-O)/16S rRNA (cytidine1409-2'-O)-methyltransferase